MSGMTVSIHLAALHVAAKHLCTSLSLSPPPLSLSLSPDERDDFTRYREDLCDVAETLQQTMHVEYLQHLSDQLSALLASSTTPPWQVDLINFTTKKGSR